MRKYCCEVCPETMIIPLFAIVTELGDEWHFCSLKCMKEFIDDEIKKLDIGEFNKG